MIAIFGASGYIGNNLISFLNKKKINYVCPKLSKKKGFIKIKNFEYESIKKFINEYNVRSIINLHAQTNIDKSFDDLEYDFNHNVKLTLSILKAIKNINKKISYIFIGTVTQLGYTNINKSIKLNYKPNPSTIFDLNKQYCEDLIRIYKQKYNLCAFTLRLANVFGPGSSQDKDRGVINKMIIDAIKYNKISLYGKGEIIRDFIYIDDVAEAIYLSLKHKSKLSVNDFYYISTNKGVSFNEFAKNLDFIVKKKYHKPIKIKFLPWPDNIKLIDKRSFVGNNKQFVKITSWKPEKKLVININKYLNYLEGKF